MHVSITFLLLMFTCCQSVHLSLYVSLTYVMFCYVSFEVYHTDALGVSTEFLGQFILSLEDIRQQLVIQKRTALSTPDGKTDNNAPNTKVSNT